MTTTSPSTTDDSTDSETIIETAADIDWAAVRDRVEELRKDAGEDLMTPARRVTVEDALYDLYGDAQYGTAQVNLVRASPNTLIELGEDAGILKTHETGGFEPRYGFVPSRFDWEPPERPRVGEFERFISALLDAAPDDYEPWLFRVEKRGKAPAVEYGSWKSEHNRISVSEAIEWMERGGNVGLAGTDEDGLVNVDIDDDDATHIDDLKPTLMCRSRSRDGYHAFYWADEGEDIPNIPTEAKGEVRANWQYVVAAGSYVETDPEDVPEAEREDAGYYTIERLNNGEIASITLDELPEVFRETMEQAQEEVEAQVGSSLDSDTLDDLGGEGSSALYDLSIARVVSAGSGNRWTHPFHDSSTESNACIEGGLLHCWRHNVSHNALQALAHQGAEEYSDLGRHFESGCMQTGSPHNRSGAGASTVKGSDAAAFVAWVYAKRSAVIPEDDPMPRAAMAYVAREHGIREDAERETEYEDEEYAAILDTVEEEYDIDSGRRSDGFTWEFDAEEVSPYYTFPSSFIAADADDEDLPEGFALSDDGQHWTCENHSDWMVGLALVAVVEDFVAVEDLTMGFVGDLDADDAARLCAIAQSRYGFAGRPPYQAILGVADLYALDIDEDGKVVDYGAALDVFEGLCETA